jgi:hypothetical protein
MAMGIRKVGDDGDNVYDSEWYKESVVKAERGNREHIAKYDRSFNGIMAKADADGADIAKASRHDIGAKGLAAATSELALDLIRHHRRRLGLVAKGGGQTAKDDPPMTSTHSEFVRDVVKQYGVVALAKSMVQDQKSYGLDEHQFTQLATEHAQRVYLNDRPDVAFSKLYQSEESVRRACSIAKAAEFSVFDIKPVVVGGPDAMHEANGDDDSAVLRATEEIQRIGREKFPFLSADQQFARIFEDKNYAALAAQAHRRPGPTTIYATPHATPGNAAYTKSDPTPNTDTAYAELMLKAEAYRNAHPDLSIAQCFEKIYTNRANVELAKRERVESAPR